MKRYLALMTLCLSVMVGCTPSVNPPTAPVVVASGYANIDDQNMGTYLAGANAFAKSIQQQVAAGTLTMGTTIKAGFNDFISALNLADSTYLAYHAGTATEAQAKTLSDAAQAKQNALPLPGAK